MQRIIKPPSTVSAPPAASRRLPELRALLRRAFAVNAPLASVGVLMVVALLGTLVGLVVDHQVITGAPAWVKPAKFAISLSIYSFTFLWLLTFVQGHQRIVAVIAYVTAAAALVEMAIISLQVMRGTTSHFNISTPFDSALFTTMGVTILCAWTAAFVLAIVIFLQPLPDRAFAWSLRFGVLLSVAGMAIAGRMLAPTPAQSAAISAGRVPMSIGAHSIGVADGGPGLPFLGWSTVGGDVRVPHFVGLHALQLLPLLGWLLMTRVPWLDVTHRVALVWTAGLTYSGVIALLTWQAMRGQSVVQPDAATVGAALALLLTAAIATIAITLHGRARHVPEPTSSFASGS